MDGEARLNARRPAALRAINKVQLSFFGQIVLGLRTDRPPAPKCWGTKERGVEEGGKGKRPDKSEAIDLVRG